MGHQAIREAGHGAGGQVRPPCRDDSSRVIDESNEVEVLHRQNAGAAFTENRPYIGFIRVRHVFIGFIKRGIISIKPVNTLEFVIDGAVHSLYVLSNTRLLNRDELAEKDETERAIKQDDKPQGGEGDDDHGL